MLWVGDMSVWSDVAVGLNGVKQTLTRILLRNVNIMMLAQAWAQLSLSLQFGEQKIIKYLHDRIFNGLKERLQVEQQLFLLKTLVQTRLCNVLKVRRHSRVVIL